jgi:hypothetical protein
MSRIVIVILIYHRHRPIDSTTRLYGIYISLQEMCGVLPCRSLCRHLAVIRSHSTETLPSVRAHYVTLVQATTFPQAELLNM